MKATSLLMFAFFVVVGADAGMNSVRAEETTGERVHKHGDKAMDSVKETYRDADDKVCETVHGKLECVGNKVVNKVKTAKDKTKSKTNELKNKVD